MAIMSKHQKLLDRFVSKPNDFTWHELETLLTGFGYRAGPQGNTGGSRRRFVHDTHAAINLHKPHPGNELKKYQMTQIITHLKGEGLI